MVRASVEAERAGVPSVSVIASAFMGQAATVARGLGVEALPSVEYPGVIATDPPEAFRGKVLALADGLTDAFSQPLGLAGEEAEPAPRDIVFRGPLDAVQERFESLLWTDGLPIVPPTVERVGAFLRCTRRDPDEPLGTLAPDNRLATIWSVAVNGVMAGCRPEYMPVLVAAVEAIADPEFRIEDAGSTPGWEPLAIIGGPVIEDLGFATGAGLLRVGNRANTSVGRFLRLYMRNVAGLRTPPGSGDKAAFGATFNVAVAENEAAARELGWPTFAMDRGFAPDESVVTVQSVVSISPPIYTIGDRPEAVLGMLADVFGPENEYWSFNAAIFGRWHPLLAMSPATAGVIARGGVSKDGVREFLYERTKIPARRLQEYARRASTYDFDLPTLAAAGSAPPAYVESTDPERLVPVFSKPEWIGLMLAGDPEKNQSRGFVNNHEQGPPVSRRVEVPPR